jgi:hypothetical protein
MFFIIKNYFCVELDNNTNNFYFFTLVKNKKLIKFLLK